MTEKITTIEDLAVMIQRTMASKEDLKDGLGALEEKMDERFNQVDARLNNLDARVGRIEADIHELRDEVVYRHEFEDLMGRMKHVERKLGIESGV